MARAILAAICEADDLSSWIDRDKYDRLVRGIGHPATPSSLGCFIGESCQIIIGHEPGVCRAPTVNMDAADAGNIRHCCVANDDVVAFVHLDACPFKMARTSSCSAPLVASALVEWIVGVPFQS